MSDFEAGDKRGDWLKALDREAEKLAEGVHWSYRILREEGWVNGRRKTAGGIEKALDSGVKP